MAHGEPINWRPGRPLDAAVCDALSTWVKRQWAGIELFEITCTLCESVDQAVGQRLPDLTEMAGEATVVKAFQNDAGVDPRKEHVGLVFSAGRREEILVGESVEALERLCPGLGWEALRSASAVGNQYDMFGLEWAQFAAEYVYWGGLSSEKEYLQEYDCDESEYEGITRAQLDCEIPAQSMFKARKMGRAALRTAATHRDSKVARVASLLLRLRALGERQGAFGMGMLTDLMEWDDTPLETPLLVGWRDYDMIFRIGDDWWNQIASGDCNNRSILGVAGIDLDEGAGALQRLEKSWRAPIAQLRLADELLRELRRDKPRKTRPATH